MRRRIAAFLATMLAVGTLAVFASAPPASAIDVCAGQGTATTSPVWYPPFTGGTGIGSIGSSQKVFAFQFTVGACVHLPSGTTGKTITATGIFLGWCGLSSGSGITGNGALFAWIGVGGFLVITGHIVGLVHAIPDTLSGQSCSPLGPGATRFIVTGAVVLLNCHGVLGPGLWLPLPQDPWGEDLFHLWFVGPCVPDPLVLD